MNSSQRRNTKRQKNAKTALADTQAKQLADIHAAQRAAYLKDLSEKQRDAAVDKIRKHHSDVAAKAAKAATMRKVKIGGGVVAGVGAVGAGAHYLYKRKKRQTSAG